MRILVPGQGFVFAAREVIQETEWGLLGPFSEGSFLRRLRVFWHAEGATVLTFRAALGSSSEATLVGIEAGISLVHRANAPGSSPPSAGFAVYSEQGGWFELPVGVRIGPGAKYVIVALTSALADITSSWVVTAEVLDFVEHAGKVED